MTLPVHTDSKFSCQHASTSHVSLWERVFFCHFAKAVSNIHYNTVNSRARLHAALLYWDYYDFVTSSFYCDLHLQKPMQNVYSLYLFVKWQDSKQLLINMFMLKYYQEIKVKIQNYIFCIFTVDGWIIHYMRCTIST